MGNGESKSVLSASAKPHPDPLPKGDFPHQPTNKSPRLPFTKENLTHMLDGYRIVVRWDVIKKRESFMQQGEPIAPADITSLAFLNDFYSGHLDEFLLQLAISKPTNPAKDWIESKAWDGVDRLEAMYATVHVQEGFPDSLARTLLYRWLLSACAAALSGEGFHTRGVLTLQGGQGIGKTSWIAALVPPDLVKLDHHLDPHNKDSVLGAVTHLVVEVGELDSSFRKDIARLKGFLTAPNDKVRPPYGKRAIEMQRRTVFAASVNDPNFLVDQTGNSRWWTIPCAKLDFEHGIDMQQLFAQLAIDYHNGVQWWLTGEEEEQLEGQNKQFQSVSVIEEQILEGVMPDGKFGKYMTARQVLLELGCKHLTNANCREAGAILRTLYGEPKRVQGRTKWKVHLRPPGQVWQVHDSDEDEY